LFSIDYETAIREHWFHVPFPFTLTLSLHGMHGTYAICNTSLKCLMGIQSHHNSPAEFFFSFSSAFLSSFESYWDLSRKHIEANPLFTSTHGA
jgi:hypothetical protein